MLLTVAQAAEKLGIAATTYRKYCAEGKIPATNFASEGSTHANWKIDDKALREWRTSQNGAAPRPKAKTPGEVPTGADWVTVQEAAKTLGMTGSGVIWRLQRGHDQAEGKKVGNRWYVRLSTLAKEKGKHSTATRPVVAEAPSGGPMRMLEKLDAIEQRLASIEAAVAALGKLWS